MRNKISSGKQLRFPVLKNIEYISIYQNRNSVLEIEGSEVEGKTWRELQFYLGERLPINSYHFSLKQKNDPAIHTGKIRAVAIGKQAIAEGENQMSNEILREFKTIKDQLAKATTSGGVSFEMLLASTKQGYEAQATYLNQKITDLNNFINELKLDIKELESDLTDCEKENAKSSGLAQYLAIGERVAQIYLGGKTKTPISLKESNTSDIPEQILNVLGVINWTLIDPESTTRIANSIQQYLSVLPKEYFKGA
jgi:hypothetical protein